MSTENGAAAPWSAHTAHNGPLNDSHPDLPILVETPSAQAPPKLEPIPAPRPGKPRDGSSFWRLARRTTAVCMIAAAFWWLVVPFFFPVTSQAVVNARMVQVRTPIDGAAAEIRHDIGDSVEAGESLMKVVSRQADTSHAAELTARRAVLIAQRKRLASDLDEAKQTREDCRDNTRKFYKELVGSLNSFLNEATARLQAAQVEREAAHVRLVRVAHMASQQTADSELDLARESETLAARRIEEAEASHTKLKQELQAAEKGFLFQRDAPSFEQRASALDSKIPQVEAEIRETDEKLAAAEKELEEERQHVSRLCEADLSAPVSGTVWKRNGELGQVVKQNENLLEIADPNTIFVEALLNQSHLATIAPGSKAVIRLTDGRVLSGRVRAVRTLGGADAEASFAVNLSCPDVKQVRVLIDLDPGVRDASLIGRHARVLIVDANPGLVQHAVMWLFARVGV